MGGMNEMKMTETINGVTYYGVRHKTPHAALDILLTIISSILEGRHNFSYSAFNTNGVLNVSVYLSTEKDLSIMLGSGCKIKDSIAKIFEVVGTRPGYRYNNTTVYFQYAPDKVQVDGNGRPVDGSVNQITEEVQDKTIKDKEPEPVR